MRSKLILWPNNFHSRESFFDFGKVFKEPTKEHGVKFTTDGFVSRPVKLREVLFIDTDDFRLYNNAFWRCGGAKCHESQWIVPLVLAVTVLVSTYLVRIKTMWRQAPITGVLVIAGGIVGHSAKVGIARGLHKVAEVIFGWVVGILVSALMSKVWLVLRAVR
jgi:hypothetical protein